MEKRSFICVKCGHQAFNTDQFRATGGFWAKMFDVQNKKFITISCDRCGYTEIYKEKTSTGENVLDFLFGG
jgi:Predicted nucleic-acid-binding protein containing a Zn-ribbon domain